MNAQPLSSDEVRATAHVHHELGPEFSDAVVESFLARIDQHVAARIDERLPATTQPRSGPDQATMGRRRAMMAGVAIGAVGAGAPLTIFAFHLADPAGGSGWIAAIWLMIAAIYAACSIGLTLRNRR